MNIKLAFLGYRDEWELDRARELASGDVDVDGVPLEPAETLQERGTALAESANVVIPWRFQVSADLADHGNLKLVQALSAGTDYLPVKDLYSRGVMVAGNHGSNAVAVSEIAVTLIVAANRHMAQQVRNIHSGAYHGDFFDTWERYHELTDKRVGIIGLGQIGSRVAKRLAGWECEIVYHDQIEIDPALEAAANAKRVGLDELLRTSDVVTLHVPLTDKTRGMIADEEFSRMKETAVIVNTCRGPVIDEASLIRALENGAIAGAGLDVTEIEPIEPDNPLLQMSNVVMSPHLAGSSIEARQKAVENAAQNASRLAAGQQPLGLISPDE